MGEAFGLIGSLCFAICSWPQAWQCLRTKDAQGIRWSFVLIWLTASIFSAVYAIFYERYILLPNYLAGGAGIAVVMFVKIAQVKRLKNASKHR